MTPSFVAKSLEQQHLKSVRKPLLQIVDINTALRDLHLQIAPFIDTAQYEAATTYVNQYIYHTHIWKIKFVCNLESPEVALMQIFHLQYIFEQEHPDLFIAERKNFDEQVQKFSAITLFSGPHIIARRNKMDQSIQAYQNKQKHAE